MDDPVCLMCGDYDDSSWRICTKCWLKMSQNGFRDKQDGDKEDTDVR